MRLLSLIPPPYNFVASGVGILLLGLIIVLTFHSCDKRHNEEQSNLVNQGITIEQVRSQSETINAVQNAEQVVQHPTSEQFNIVCGKYDRNCPHGS